MIYNMAQNNRILKFKIGFRRRTNGTEYAGYSIKIEETSYMVSVYWSAHIAEANWVYNGDAKNGLHKKGITGRKCFLDSLLDEMTSLTIKIAIHFWSQ